MAQNQTAPQEVFQRNDDRLLMAFGESECAVADDAVARSSCVAGIAEVNAARLQTPPSRQMQQAANRAKAASAVFIPWPGAQSFDVLGRCLIHHSGGGVILVMAQVCTDHDAAFRTVPKRRERFHDSLIGCVAGEQLTA